MSNTASSQLIVADAFLEALAEVSNKICHEITLDRTGVVTFASRVSHVMSKFNRLGLITYLRCLAPTIRVSSRPMCGGLNYRGRNSLV